MQIRYWILFLALLLLLIIGNAYAGQKEICNVIANRATMIEYQHQKGIAEEDMLRAMIRSCNNKPTAYAVHACRQLLPLFGRIVNAAYSIPIYTSEIDKTSISEKFGRIIFYNCVGKEV